jgi:hypothetical protein
VAATSTRNGNREVEALEAEIVQLMHEVDRYRTACEDTMQQLDWCIGYFTGCNKRTLAKSLAANRSAIRRHILERDEQSMPTNTEESR